MARVKGAMMTRKRRKKVLKLAKGYFGAKSRLFRVAKEAVMKLSLIHIFWIAQYYKVPFYPYRFQIWQYSSKGKVNGINGDVDLNIMFQ